MTMQTTSSGRRVQQRAACIAKAMMAIGASLGLAVSFAATRVYSTTADFNTGTTIGVSTVNDELKLAVQGSTFPVLWVANGGEDTLTRFDTVNNKETARYRTWFGPSGQAGHQPHLGNPFAGAAPSRTAVDLDGNAYVLNRHFDGRSAVLIKVLASSYIDRNASGTEDTSADANNDGIITDAEMKPLADSNGNGIIDPAEIRDERVAWAMRVPDGIAAPFRTGALGRSLCIAPSGNLWVGLYNDGTYYEVSSTDGRTLRGPINIGVTPYGCLVDGNNKLWSANLSSAMGRLDTVTGVVSPAVSLIDSTYGIAIDNTHVYFASQSNSSYLRVNKTTLAQDRPAAGPRFFSVGISVDGSGNVVTGVYTGGGVTKYNAATGAVICSNTGYANMSETRGVIADADGNIWQISVSGNLVAKYSPTCAKLGTFPVGNSPYTYSDAAGLAARTITTRTGDWNAVYDAGTAGTAWGKVLWNAALPQGAGLQVSTRTSDNLLTLASQPFLDVGNGADFGTSGRFIEVRTRLTANNAGETPVIFDLTLQSRIGTCDVDGDGDIDNVDLGRISRGRGQIPQANDPRDSDGDGRITPNDVKVCIPLCTRLQCAVQ